MEKFACFGRKLEHFCSKFVYIGQKLALFCKYSCRKLSCFNQFCQRLIWLLFRFLVVHVNPVWIQLCYLIVVSLVGYLALKLSKVRSTSSGPQDLDVFFTSVSATTVSSMSTVEMQVFSNTQLIIMTILMFVGGEIFVSMLGLQLARFRFPENLHQSTDKRDSACSTINVNHTSTIYCSFESKIELGLATRPQLEQDRSEIEKLETNVENGVKSLDNDALRYHSIRSLTYVVLGYLLIIHVVGSGVVYLYISLVPSASQALNSRGLEIQTFSVFTAVSSFTNCGFIPTNENMMVFKKNSGLLLFLMPQILMGNTLYPPCLLLVIWVLNKVTKRPEFDFMLRNYRDMGYRHLLSGTHAALLAATVFGFTLIQFILFCSMEWNSEAMEGLSLYQKFVGSLFQTVNSRYAGESVFDLSSIYPAILVLFIVMMYLPPYTAFIPSKKAANCEVSKTGKGCGRHRRRITFNIQCLMFSQLSYLTICIILICITERYKMKDDSLNFNVLNITLEVISAYGNVGFSTGYSCKRQLKPESSCTDTWYGFAGRWSTHGKLILIFVMFFGRLKEFNMKGGKAWKLS